jgi:tRNA1(Val) A37 N6-methylase TrmN6
MGDIWIYLFSAENAKHLYDFAKVAELGYALDLGCGITAFAIMLLDKVIPSKE